MRPYGDHVTTSVIPVCDSGVTVMPSRAIGLTLMVFTSRRVVRSLPSHASFAKGSLCLLSLAMIRDRQPVVRHVLKGHGGVP